jgi:hypothetical protein
MPDDNKIFPDEFVPNIETHNRTSYKQWTQQNPGEAEKYEKFRDEILTWQDGDATPIVPTLATKYGKALVAAGKMHMSVTDIGSEYTPPVIEPPPTPVGALKFTPPGFPNYVGYQNWSPTNADARRSFSGADVVVHMPNTPITVDGGVQISSARNVVVIGGEIFDSFVYTAAQAAAVPSQAYRQIGLYLTAITGIAHIEGLWIHGPGVGDGIQSGNGNTGATIRIQNTFIRNQHPTQNLSQAPPNNFNGSHPDGLQCYNGPKYWDFYRMTIVSSGTFRTWQSNGSTPRYIQGVTMESCDIVTQYPRPGHTYALWDDFPSDADVWPEYHKDLWFDRDTNLPGSFLHRRNDRPDGFNVGVLGITGEATNWGLRPGGFLLKEPTTGDLTTCGVGYVSPGYQ